MLTECPKEERISFPCNCRGFSGCHGKEGMAQHSNSHHGDGGQEGGGENVLTVGSFPFSPLYSIWIASLWYGTAHI